MLSIYRIRLNDVTNLLLFLNNNDNKWIYFEAQTVIGNLQRIKKGDDSNKFTWWLNARLPLPIPIDLHLMMKPITAFLKSSRVVLLSFTDFE